MSPQIVLMPITKDSLSFRYFASILTKSKSLISDFPSTSIQFSLVLRELRLILILIYSPYSHNTSSLTHSSLDLVSKNSHSLIN